jgi:Protein of unknown function (DUF1573)
MKKIIALLTLTIFLNSCNSNDKIEVGNKTTMEITKEFKAGNIILGEEIEAVFKLKNTGNYPLIIAEVKGSCSCTVADYPEDPIAPGETEEITATVRTDNAAPGQLSKEVRVVANTEPSLSVLNIRANVIRK